MATWATQVRDTLVTQFGAPWAAKTTEELAEAPELPEALGREQAERLIEFLRAADRAKFALAPEAADQGEAWRDWVVEFVTSASTAAGATSRITGR